MCYRSCYPKGVTPSTVWTKAQQLHRRREADNTQPLGDPHKFVSNELLELIDCDDPGERAKEYGDLVATVISLGLRIGLNPWSCAAASQARTVARLDYISENAQTPVGSEGHRQEAAHLWDAAKAQQSGTLTPPECRPA